MGAVIPRRFPIVGDPVFPLDGKENLGGVELWGLLEMFKLPEPERVADDTSLVVTMKDTGSMTDWVTGVRQLGVTVVGKVEEAQDFRDADTPDERHPYRNLDLVLCQGKFDADGSPRPEDGDHGQHPSRASLVGPPVAPQTPPGR